MNIYVIHYKKLVQRKNYIEKALAHYNNFNTIFIDEYDRETITLEDITNI